MMGGLAGKPRDHAGRVISRLALAILVIGLAACGDTTARGSVNGPYASPQQSPAEANISRSCEKVKSGQAPSGIATAKVYLSTPGTDLQRVSDDLAGGVPGGNVSVDASNASRDVDALYDWALRSNLCDPLKSQLIDKAKALKDANAALAAAASTGGDVAAALQTSQSAYKDISDFVNNPPGG
jgi:hypothetical protein